MNRKGNYEDCLNFIENYLKINLFDYQKELLKYIFENKEVRTARGCGRKMVADAYGKYMAHLHSENDYSVKPDVIIPNPIQNKLLGNRVETEKTVMSPHITERGYFAKFYSIDEEPLMITETCPECGHELIDTVISVYPSLVVTRKECTNCDWMGEYEEHPR